jgi:tRNA-2-methylthio-N6-dimethylallyladenosine synthase
MGRPFAFAPRDSFGGRTAPRGLCYNRRVMTKAYFIDTMGCQMNERDSETIAGVLSSLGYQPAARPEDASVLVLNTCAVREKPEHKVFSKLGDLRKLKARRPDAVIVVAGCVAQVAHEDIRRRAPYVDVILGPRNIASLEEMLQSATQAPQVVADDSEIVPEGLAVRRTEGVGAFVNISYGCDNFCTYCVVPYARGREQSRAPQAVVAEVERAVADGFREVTLLGQNVNSYRGQGGTSELADFAELLALVDAVPGLERLRFTTSHPKDLSPRLIEAMATLASVCEHLHLPIQAGDDEVLRRMGRGYTYAQYRALVEAARAAMPGVAITTDVMVGFPGETEEQFRATYRAFEEIRFDQAFMFKYSDRPGTKASQMPDKVAEADKQDRLERLVALQNRTSREVNRAQVGEVVEVLVEGADPKSPARLRGRTRGNKLVIFEPHTPHPARLVRELVRVRTQAGFLWGFEGRRVADEG